MNTVRKRIFCITASLLLAAFSLLPSPVPVQAASVPSVNGGDVESLMALLDLLINAATAGGAAEFVANYNSDMDLLDAFLDFVGSIVPTGQAPEAKFYLADGTSTTLDDLRTGLEDGTVTLPNEQEWGKYRVGFGDDFASILEAWEERGGGSGGSGGEPEDPKDPEFSKVDSFMINAGFLALVSDFFVALWAGDIDAGGFTFKDVCNLPEYFYDPQSTGLYYTFGPINGFGGYAVYSDPVYNPVSNHAACFIRDLYFNAATGEPTGEEGYTWYRQVGGKLSMDSIPGRTGVTVTIRPMYIHDNAPRVVFSNYPIFDDRDAALNYLLTGDAEGVLNGLRYDYDKLARNISAVLAPMSGVRLRPSVFQKTYSGMKTAYQTEISPKPATDVETDTDNYTDTMKKPVDDTVPDHKTDTDTETDTDDGNKGDTETGTDTDLDDYKRDLRLIFPFCIPFDFIALLRAMDSEPVTPVFEVPFSVPALDINEKVVLDMSFLDDFMVVFRACEVISFMIMLMFATHKMIKW